MADPARYMLAYDKVWLWLPPMKLVRLSLAGTVLATVAGPAGSAEEVLPGPVPARVLRVVDGDTVVVRARIWLGQDIETSVRLDGVDTPERRSRCEAERALAEKATQFLTARLTEGDVVSLRGVTYGKFAGRVLGRIETRAGEDLSTALIRAGLARPYDGGKREPWC